MSSHPLQRNALVSLLYSEHHGWLSAWLRKKLRCPADAADLTQDTFIRLLQGDLEGELREPRAFLRTTATRLLIDLIRRRRVEQSYLAALALYCAGAVEASAEDHQQAIDTLVALAAMLEALPARPREAFLLCRLEGLSHADIADRLGVSVSSVKQYMATVLAHCYRIVHG